MGEVLAAEDLSTGRKLALKRLLPGAKQRSAVLLQREYHTLIGLAHPHVVQAYDYGTSDGLPFYTMELLSGCDVDGLAPLPWPEVARIMRDVASALALIHARHVVHRDVTARNVWRTDDGTIKLIDFGALSSFGEVRDVAGTPPFVAPEVLRTRVLDQRTDLYSVGALGYYLLTGRHAYPARSLADLEQHWSSVFLPPSQCVRELARADLPAIPEALEELIEALLESEPDARPVSAAEVIDRLAIVLPAEAHGSRPLAVQGVLASKAFVGRTAELARMRSLLKQTMARLGTSVVLLGPEGAGRTRLLSEIGVEARVAGATVLVVPGDGDRTALSAAARCALKMLESLPTLARNTAETHASVLGHLSPALREKLAIAVQQLERFPETAGEARMRMQRALSAWWLETAQAQPIVMLLDDLQDIDEASASLFAALARQLGDTRLLLVASVHTEAAAGLQPAVQAFIDKALTMKLEPLREEHCAEMLSSMFGNVEHLARTAQRLAVAAEGNPKRVVELAEHLVRTDAVRYVEGAWVLPQDIAGLKLPDTWSALDQARLLSLSADAHALARVLSIPEGVLSLELCGRLSVLESACLFGALNELATAGVLVGVDDGYRFRREEVRRSLSATLSVEERRRGDAIVGEALLLAPDPTLLDRMMAGLHLLRSGDDLRGVETVNRAAFDLVQGSAEERAALATLLEQTLPLIRARHARDHELLPVLCSLALCGYFVDRRLGMTYGAEALERAQRALGLHHARWLRHCVGRKLGITIALFIAAFMFRRRARSNKLVPSFPQAMRLLFAASGSLAGMYALCADRSGALAAARAIEPMTALGPGHVASVVYEFALGCAMSLQNRLGANAQHWAQLLARLDAGHPITGLGDQMRTYYSAASLYAYGASECGRDNSRALELADRLEQQPLQLYRLSAEQIRAAYHAHQGNSQLAAQHRARLDVHALQRGMTWQVEIWSLNDAATNSARNNDAMGAKRVAEQLRHLSKDTPSLASYAHAARASYLLLRGRFPEAAEEAKHACAQRGTSLRGATEASALLARAYNQLGKHDEAHATCTRALAGLTRDDLRYTVYILSCQIELAQAEAGLGNQKRATEQLDALLVEHAPGKGALTLGALHEARAQVALRSDQKDVAAHHYAEMERWYRGTGSPTLIQYCDSTIRKSRSRAGPRIAHQGNELSKLTSATASGTSSQQAPEQLLTSAVRAATAAEGLLFRVVDSRLTCVARTNDDILSKDLENWCQTRLNAALSFKTETDSTEDEPTDHNVLVHQGKTFRFALLMDENSGAEPVVGAIVLSDPMRNLSAAAVRALAAQLLADA